MSNRTTQAPQPVGPLLRLAGKQMRAAFIALLALAGALPCAPASATVPGMPGTPQAGTTVFTEDFENGSGVTELEVYVGDAPVNAMYSADPYWLLKERCNGFILSYGIATPPDASYCNGGQWQGVRSMAYALGVAVGNPTPATNRAVATLSAGGCTTNALFCGDGPITQTKVFETVGQPVTLSAANRFIAFSVNLAATACDFGPHPLLRFFLRNSAGTEIPVSTSAIDPCASGQVIPAGTNPPGFIFDIRYGTFVSTDSFLLPGTSLGIVLRDEATSSAGNDFAVDTVRALDVTPQLDKSFSPITVLVGGVSTLTFTITNTTDLLPKNGWSFADNLPAGLVVASPNAATTTCTAGAVTAPVGGATITASGNLNAGQASCTVSVNVTSSAAGTYNNCPTTNVTNLIGLNPPACAAVTFVPPATLIIIKDAVPNDAQDFAFAATGTGLSGFSLDDDGDATLSNTRTFTGLASGSYSVTETTPLPTAWSLTGLSCTDASGGTTTSGATANIDLATGETVTCTFTNTRSLSNLSITKTNTPGTNGEVDQSGDTVIRGTTTTYTIVATNNGPDAVTGATVRDPAQAGLICNDPVPCTGNGCPAPTVPLLSLQGSGVVLGTVANGGTVTFSLTCTVP